MIITKIIKTDLGDMIAGVYDQSLCLLEFHSPERLERQSGSLTKLFSAELVEGNHILFSEVERQLNAYFDGRLKAFSVPLDLRGADFQSGIWKLLLTIPYGKTISYGELATIAGDHNKMRAVGRANGENRIAIIVPCHRVIGASGKLVGYAGELWRKKELLDLEKKTTGQPIQMGFDF